AGSARAEGSRPRADRARRGARASRARAGSPVSARLTGPARPPRMKAPPSARRRRRQRRSGRREGSMRKYRLLAPGPTPIPPEVLEAMARPILHHRTPEFEALFARVRSGLAELLE